MQKKCDAYIIDTCKITHTGEYIPGAIVYAGRKVMETRQWKESCCSTQEEADNFVRDQFAADMREMDNVGDVPRA